MMTVALSVAKPAAEPEWLVWLRARVVEVGSMQAVAEEIGISRPAVSLLLAGKYTAGTDKVAAKIMAFVEGDRVWCPHLQAAIAAATCVLHHNAPMPMSSPTALKLWIACKTCPNRGGTK